MVKPADGKPDNLQQFRRLVWERFTKWDFMVELCRQIRYGEIRIIIHDHQIKDVHVDFHLRSEQEERG
ncbi:MAG: hypothetical protein WCF84_22565 [Anaerolineae bacterium]